MSRGGDVVHSGKIRFTRRRMAIIPPLGWLILSALVSAADAETPLIRSLAVPEPPGHASTVLEGLLGSSAEPGRPVSAAPAASPAATPAAAATGFPLVSGGAFAWSDATSGATPPNSNHFAYPDFPPAAASDNASRPILIHENQTDQTHSGAEAASDTAAPTAAAAAASGRPPLDEHEPLFGSLAPSRNLPARPDQTPASASSVRNLIVLVFYGLFISGLAIFMSWLYYRYGPKNRPGAPCAAMEVLGKTHLDPRNSCVLLRVGDRAILVGVARGQSMTALGEITDPEAMTVLMEQARPKSDAGRGLFANLFRRHYIKNAREAAACGYTGNPDHLAMADWAGEEPSSVSQPPFAGESPLADAGAGDAGAAPASRINAVPPPHAAPPESRPKPSLPFLFAAWAARRGVRP